MKNALDTMAANAIYAAGDEVSVRVGTEQMRGYVAHDWPPADGDAPFVRVLLPARDAVCAVEPADVALIETRLHRLGIDPNDDIPYGKWAAQG